MPSSDRPTTLPLGNDFDIRITEVELRGVRTDALVLRGYISATRAGGPIHANLSAVALSQGVGTADYIAGLTGVNLTAHLTSYLFKQVWVVAESVTVGLYRDAYPVTVVEDQSA